MYKKRRQSQQPTTTSLDKTEKSVTAVGAKETSDASSEEFTHLLLEIHRNRLLRLYIDPKSDLAIKTSKQAAILALLWKLDSRQLGDPGQRFIATRVAFVLGMDRTAWSTQTAPLVENGLCAALPMEAGQRDRRNRFYVITEKGKEALNLWLHQEYTLPGDSYQGAGIDRARNVLQKLQTDVEQRIKARLPEY
jgi:DNA-binding MarR family transcriptional regulator